MLKIASLFVPVYIPPAHYGQTPEVHPTRLVEKWELELVQRAENVLKHKPTEQLFHDKANGRAERKVVIRYDFSVDMETPALAEIIALCIATFSLKAVTVALDDAVVGEFTPEAAEELSIGAHKWSEQ